MYWRSLGELADTPEFREYLHREFPEQASEWNDPKGRRQFLKLMSASLALAGVGACTKQPAEEIVPYIRQPEDIVPGPSPVFRQRHPARPASPSPSWSRAIWGVRPKSKATPSIRPASARPTRSPRPPSSICTIPDRAQTITYRGEIRPWGEFLTRHAGGGEEPEGPAGSGAPVPDRPDHLPVARRVAVDDPDGKPAGAVASVRSGHPRRRTAARRARRPTSSITSTRPTSSCRSTPISWPAAPAACATRRTLRPAGGCTDDRKEMNRFYAIESTPSLTGAKADHRLVLKAGEIEGFARQLSGASEQGREALRVPGPEPESRAGQRRRGEVGRGASPKTFRRTAARRWSSREIISRRQCTRPRTP